jgi:hypothetical protein
MMKLFLSKSGPYIFFILFVLSLLFISINNQAVVLAMDMEPERIVEINPSNPTRLMTGARCGPPAGATLSGGIRLNNEDPRASEWTEGWNDLADKIIWNVKATVAGIYEIGLVYRCSKGSAGSSFEISCGDVKIDGLVRESVSPYFGNSWEEVKVNGTLEIPEGISKISIRATHIPQNSKVVMDLFALKLTPLTAKKQIEEDSLRAIKSRASTDWFVDTQYGLMVHWLPESTPPKGPTKSYEDAVNDFYVENFSKMVSETGAGYVIFHIAGHKMPAPILAWEEVHGTGSTSKRDLISDLSKSLDKYNIRLILGQGLPEIGRFWQVGFKLHTDRFKKIYTEIGHRYGKNLAGVYFDGGREMTAFNVDWEGMFNACKAGNPDRILSYNFWVFPLSTEWLDFWCGEGGYPHIKFEKRYIQAGAGKDLQSHVMFPIDDEYRWWFKDQNHIIGPPVYSDEQLVSWVKEAISKKTVTTLNIAIYQDGTVSSKTLSQLNVLKKAMD